MAALIPRLVYWLFGIFVFASTFSIAISQLSMGLILLIFPFAIHSQRHKLLSGSFKWFFRAAVLYVAWLVVVCLAAEAPVYSLNHIREEVLFLIIPVAIFVLRDSKRLNVLLALLASGTILTAIVGVVFSLAGVQWSWGRGFEPVIDTLPRVAGTFSNSLTYGNFAAVAAVFLLGHSLAPDPSRSPRLRTLLITGGLAASVATLICASRGPVVALVVGLICLVFFLPRASKRVSLVVLCSLLILGALLPVNRARFTQELKRQLFTEWPGSRAFIWKNSLEIVAENLLVGVGPGNFQPAYVSKLNDNVPKDRWYSHAHNDLLQAAARSGLPGGLTFILLWAAVLTSLWRGYRRSGAELSHRRIALAALVGSLTFLVASLSEATFFDEEVRALLMFVWATGLSPGYKDQTPAGCDQVEP